VSGGTAVGPNFCQDGHYFALTRHGIDTRAVIARLLTGAEGRWSPLRAPSATHQGRATRCLDYEGYESMALKMMLHIGLEIAAQYEWPHRDGPPSGPRADWRHQRGIVVTAPHRGPASSRAGGHRSPQERVPIWKKEHFVMARSGWKGSGAAMFRWWDKRRKAGIVAARPRRFARAPCRRSSPRSSAPTSAWSTSSLRSRTPKANWSARCKVGLPGFRQWPLRRKSGCSSGRQRNPIHRFID